MSKVRERQPLVMQALSAENLETLLDRQTSAVLKSQTVMYEVLILNEQEQLDEDADECY